MNSITKRLLAAMLAASTVVCMAVGCAEKADDEEKPVDSQAEIETIEEEAETDRAHAKDNIPADLSFDGATVTMHGRGDSGSIRELSTEQTGDVVDDAIYKRNLSVEQRLGIDLETFTPYGWQNYSQALAQIRSSIASGDDEFQLIAAYSAPGPALATEGLLLNLLEVNYIDETQPWWAQSIVNDLTVNGNLAFITGDISLTMLSSAYSMAVNFNLAEDHNITGIYDTVENGQWTIDKLYEYSENVYEDVDGNGRKNSDDIFGLYFGLDYVNDADSFMQGSKVTLTTRGEDGYPYLEVNKEKLADLVTKVYRLFYECSGSFLDRSHEITEIFPKGTVLFAPSYLEFYTVEYKGMEENYGILPYPKYDENQDTYSTRVQDGVSIWCIPTTVKNPDLCGAALEALCAESYRTVTPVYFDLALKVKYTRDDQSSHMLDLIRDGVMFNFEIIYNNEMGGAYNIMRELISNKKDNFASAWDKKEKSYIKALDSLVEKLAKAEEEK